MTGFLWISLFLLLLLDPIQDTILHLFMKLPQSPPVYESFCFSWPWYFKEYQFGILFNIPWFGCVWYFLINRLSLWIMSKNIIEMMYLTYGILSGTCEMVSLIVGDVNIGYVVKSFLKVFPTVKLLFFPFWTVSLRKKLLNTVQTQGKRN
jgi:hypothetical protein